MKSTLIAAAQLALAMALIWLAAQSGVIDPAGVA